MNAATLIDMALKDAGIPIIGVNGQASGFTATYAPEATADQQSQGEAIRAQILADVEAAMVDRVKKETIKEVIKKLTDKTDTYVLAIDVMAELVNLGLNQIRTALGIPVVPFAVIKADFLQRVQARLN